MNDIKLLECTLRDGAYITNGNFGKAAIGGVISKMNAAGMEIIECGWLKNTPYAEGTTYFHKPEDLIPYLPTKQDGKTYCVMIDWDRYDVKSLPQYDRKSIDAIRVVFPHGKYREGINVAETIKAKGYKVFLQAANTLSYTDDELRALAEAVNKLKPEALSVVDTFGAMFAENLEHITGILEAMLDKNIALGFHSHNNQQLSFALSMNFVKLLEHSERGCIIDSSLCGMGRGAGNAPTELVAGFLNRKYGKHYNPDEIMDTIDTYMESFRERYQWGYSTQYFIAGQYCCHVNNIAYLMKNHRTSAKDMRNIIESLPSEKRTQYDYDLLEEKYLAEISREIDDTQTVEVLKGKWENRKILMICPGKSAVSEKEKIDSYIRKEHPVVIGVNAILQGYSYDNLFFTNTARYDYAKQNNPATFKATERIIPSNIKTQPDENEMIINYNNVIKRGWEHFDNAAVCCLRLMDYLGRSEVTVAGFDGFKTSYNESYADVFLPSLNPDGKWNELNGEIKSIVKDYRMTAKYCRNIEFLTPSIFDEGKG